MIQLTENAVKAIRRIQESKSENNGAMVRIRVFDGGCSGLKYQFDFDNQPAAPNDRVFEQEGVKVVLDAKSALYMTGTEIDYEDGLSGKGFKFRNPNAKSTCGCGSSFSA